MGAKAMSVVNSPDKEIINRFLTGSEVGFEELVSCYEKKIYSLCLSLTHNESDSEAVLSDVFCRALDEIGSVASQNISIANWLYRATVENAAAREQLREPSDATKSAMEQILSSAVAQHYDETGDEEGLFRSAIQNLPYEYRTVYVLHEVVSVSLDDVMEILQLSELETRAYLHRARLMVCRYLQRFRPATAAMMNASIDSSKRPARIVLN